MVNATMNKQPRPGQDFFPLSVDYEEKLYTILIMIFIWKYSNLLSTQRNQGNSKTASELPTPAIQLQIFGICAER